MLIPSLPMAGAAALIPYLAEGAMAGAVIPAAQKLEDYAWRQTKRRARKIVSGIRKYFKPDRALPAPKYVVPDVDMGPAPPLQNAAYFRSLYDIRAKLRNGSVARRRRSCRPVQVL